MSGKFTSFCALSTLAVFVACWDLTGANPAIGISNENQVWQHRALDRFYWKHATGYDPLEVCIENCAQCKKMLGAWFDGPLCADSCIKMKGKLIPECEDFASIAPFLNKL